MDKFIQYFKDNTTLLWVTVIILAILIAVVITIFLTRRALHKKSERDKTVEDLTRDLVSKPPVPNDSLFLDPDMNATTVSGDAPSNEDKNKAENKDEKVEDFDEKSADKPINDEMRHDEEAVTLAEAPPLSTVKKAPEKSEVLLKAEENLRKKYAGKWLIYVEDGKYAANLVASNGEILLRTEAYTALSGVKSGIATVKNNIEKDNFALSVDKNGNFFFKLYSSSTRLLCVSEAYSSKSACESAIESCKRFAKTAVIEIDK